MSGTISHFLTDTEGAVTVDWVVLTAAIVGLAVAVLLSVGGPTKDFADDIGTAIANTEVATY